MKDFLKNMFWVFPALMLSAAPSWAATLTILVKEAPIRRQPQFFSPAVAKIKLGERLESSAEQGGWHKVSADGKSGWIHASAVTAKKVKLGSGESVGGSATTAEEITLAGKGFNEEVEKSYRQKHALNFEAVNAMEKRKVAEEEILRFLKEGGLFREPGP